LKNQKDRKMKMAFILIVTFALQITFAALPEAETKSFEAQYRLAKNTALPMSARWKALLSAAENANSEQFQLIIGFSKDKDWFMRNATLIALEKMGTDVVFDKAKELLTDKALVVRSAAADILIRLKSPDVRQMFSDEISKNYNFNGKTSLWIRPQMMRFLVENPIPAERSFFVKSLFEKDQQMALLSVEALQKLTQVRFSGKTQSEVISKWKSYAQEKKW
jgi:hypothetical protein